MPAFLVIALLMLGGPAFAQSTTPSAVSTPPPSTPPGLPSPAQSPIPPLSSANSTLTTTPVLTTTAPVTAAAPAFTPPVNELGPNDIGLDNADIVNLDNDNNADVKGNVRLRYRTYTLFADEAKINTDTGIGVLTGHVRLRSDDGKTTVSSLSPDSRLTLNLRSGVYDVIGANAVIAPSQLPAVTGLALPIRLYGGDIEDNPRFIDARDTSATTCDFAQPHYFFKARSTIIIPGKKLIARDVTLYRRKRKIITIPYLYFPLDNRYERQGITPQVGYDEEDGYFAKFAVPYVLAATAVGILRLDLMSQSGVGTGFTQGFTTGGDKPPGAQTASASGALGQSNAPTFSLGTPYSTGISGFNPTNGGTIQIYHLNDRSTGLDTTTGSLADSQLLFHNVHLAIDSQFQNNSDESSLSQSNSISTLFSVSRSVKGASTNVTSDITQSDYGSGTSRTIASSFDENNALSKETNLDFKVNLSQFGTPSFEGFSGTYQQTLATNLDVTTHTKGYDLELLTNTFNAAASGSSGVISGGVQRLPEVNFQSVPSQTDRLLPGLLPPLSKYILDIGDFKETVDNTQDMRLQMGLDTGDNVFKHKDVTTSFAGSFLQSLYSDNTAEYILQNQLGATYNFQRQSSFGTTYSYLRPYGYTPFLFDQTGSYNSVNVNLNYQPTKRLLATFSSGFDIGQDHSMNGLPATPWLDINGQIEYRIDKLLLNVLTSSYDPNRGMLFNVADTTRVTLPWGLALNSALNYVPQSDRFSNVNGDLVVPWITDQREQSGYTLRALAGYNGLTDQITYKGFELTRSWHDWELSGIYQDNAESLTPGSSFYINFRLKAFPGYEPFGVGEFGQGLDTGIGQVY